MKERLTPYQVMEEMARNMATAYAGMPEKPCGVIQFHFSHQGEKIDCHLVADHTGLQLVSGIGGNPDVTLSSSFYHWLDLAAGRLHPVMGAVMGKLKFKGDTSVFSKLMPKQMFHTDISAFSDPVTSFEKAPWQHWKSHPKVFVLNASPRAGKGYTHFFLDAFCKGLEKGGATVSTCQLKRKKIHRCGGCWHCWLSGTGQCIFKDKDDFDQIYKTYADADLIVFAFPLYSDGMPGGLKDFIDRCVAHLHPFMVDGIYKTRHPRRQPKNQAAVVFSVCGFIEMENFDAVSHHFKKLSHNMHLPIVAEVFRSASIYLYGNPFLYQKLNEVLAALEEGGAEIARSGRMSRKNSKIIGQKIDTLLNFKNMSNYFWSDTIGSGKKDF